MANPVGPSSTVTGKKASILRLGHTSGTKLGTNPRSQASNRGVKDERAS